MGAFKVLIQLLIGLLASALVALVGVAAAGSPSVAAPPGATHAYSDDTPFAPTGRDHIHYDRGPVQSSPAARSHAAVERWLHGDQVPPCPAVSSLDGDWAAHGPLVQAARAAATAREHAGRAAEEYPWPEFGRVAANDAGRTAVRTCNSFTAATLVLLADGSKKAIKDVKLGDWVMATDPVSGERGPRKVVDLTRHGGLHTMVAVRLSNGSTIDATDHHPFWVESRSDWVDAIDLQPGDLVITADGDRLGVAGLGISEQDLTAYNLTIDDLHTYYVGDDAVLVHNVGCDEWASAFFKRNGGEVKTFESPLGREDGFSGRIVQAGRERSS